MTFHVRLVSPPDQTNGLVGLLAADSGVSNLVVLPGTAQRPDGDAVQFDVRSQSANSVFRVAVLAGIVGVVSLTEARASALIGVFISVTTIPAAADIALSLAYSSWKEARGSAFQLLLNVTVLMVVGTLVLRFQRIIWRVRERAEGQGEHATDLVTWARP